MKTRKRFYLVSALSNGAVIDLVITAIDAHKVGIAQCGSGQYSIDLIECYEISTRADMLVWFGHIALSMERTFPAARPLDVNDFSARADQWSPSQLDEARRRFRNATDLERMAKWNFSTLKEFSPHIQNLRRTSDFGAVRDDFNPTRYRK